MRRKKVKPESQSNPMVDDDQPSSTTRGEMDVEASVACPKCERIFSGQQVLDADGSLTPVGVSSWDCECPKCGALVRYRSPTDRGASERNDAVPREDREDAADVARARRAQRGEPRSTVEELADGEIALAPSERPDEVTVCWGEEKFFPDPQDRYSSCVAGAVFVKTFVRPGETPVQAARRAYKVARAAGATHRDEKVAEFVAKLKEVRDRY